tara:strand:- start:74125 stop:75396 length:1272 start_codon:yes stop_codon:yes gene_type:complete
MPISKTARLNLTAVILLTLVACSEDPAHLQPTGFAVSAPELATPFDQYLEQSRTQVSSALQRSFTEDQRPFGENYSLAEVAAMRSPYQLESRSGCAPGQRPKGFLLLHGLSDSPYLLSAMARDLVAADNCALARALLLPGHGTAPGDLAQATRRDWQQAARYGVESFAGEVDSLTVVGYSAGATLAIDLLNRQRESGSDIDQQVDSLILMSPALALPGFTVRLSPYLGWLVRWTGIEQERDAAKYESFSVPAGGQFYQLLQELEWQQWQPLDAPVMMVVSDADETVSVPDAAQFFCQQLSPDSRQLLWYDSAALQAPDCSGVTRVDVSANDFRVRSLSHVGLTLPPDDPHYGFQGFYRQCLHYAAESEQRQQCQQDDDSSIFAERHLLESLGIEQPGTLLRRTTFNPFYDDMMSRILRFLGQE